MTRSTPARLYQLRSNRTICAILGFRNCVTRLIVLPFPAASRPSNTTTILARSARTHSCSFTSSACSRNSSFSYSGRFSPPFLLLPELAPSLPAFPLRPALPSLPLRPVSPPLLIRPALPLLSPGPASPVLSPGLALPFLLPPSAPLPATAHLPLRSSSPFVPNSGERCLP